ncbi:hypothetical protein EBI_26026 [Enterocytozoon bieneusi H348]|nr:hypothetical protein EBI_26026 [Enterocytozoon bieneusi H348]|eukprot:XP_002649687.1 hypothetical protein EBI_26026 [Enterocytozoon bieneusi H348]
MRYCKFLEVQNKTRDCEQSFIRTLERIFRIKIGKLSAELETVKNENKRLNQLISYKQDELLLLQKEVRLNENDGCGKMIESLIENNKILNQKLFASLEAMSKTIEDVNNKQCIHNVDINELQQLRNEVQVLKEENKKLMLKEDKDTVNLLYAKIKEKDICIDKQNEEIIKYKSEIAELQSEITRLTHEDMFLPEVSLAQNPFEKSILFIPPSEIPTSSISNTKHIPIKCLLNEENNTRLQETTPTKKKPAKKNIKRSTKQDIPNQIEKSEVKSYFQDLSFGNSSPVFEKIKK